MGGVLPAFELNADFVAFTSIDRNDLLKVLQYSLTEQEPGGEFSIVSGRTHGDGDGSAADTNFERVFDCHGVRPGNHYSRRIEG